MTSRMCRVPRVGARGCVGTERCVTFLANVATRVEEHIRVSRDGILLLHHAYGLVIVPPPHTVRSCSISEIVAAADAGTLR